MAMYDAVVAYKTDRWSRGTQEDFTRIEFWATQNGKRLIIVDGPQYPARADRFDSDYWQWQAEKMAARREWELGRERVVRATDALRRENKFVGRIPWGYVTEGPKRWGLSSSPRARSWPGCSSCPCTTPGSTSGRWSIRRGYPGGASPSGAGLSS
jgi:DNA invertase Pin-like site-specific DNA recombinase